MKYILSITISLICLQVHAQHHAPKHQHQQQMMMIQHNIKGDTSHAEGWAKGILINVGISQGSTSNWVAGGEKFSFSLSSYVNLHANLKDGRRKWFNSLDMYYGVFHTTSEGTRKNDDRFDLYSKYIWDFHERFGVAAITRFRTGLFPGYDYGKSPKELLSGFLAPAYLTVAPGIDVEPTDYFSIFFTPIAGRWVIIANHAEQLSEKYNLNPGETVRTDIGAYISANFSKEVAKKLFYNSRLDLYSNYLNNPQNIDINWTNMVGFKFNKLLTFTYGFDLIYDDDIRQFGPNGTSPGTQIKSTLNIGLTTKF